MASSKFTKQDYIDYIKLQLTGGLLDLEIEDEVISKYIDAALIELRRYMDETVLITVPFAKCIDLKGYKYSSIVNVYRTEGFTGDVMASTSTSEVDPMYAQQWMAFSSGGLTYNLKNYVYNYMSYNTLLQMRNTASTDLSWVENKQEEKLYINADMNRPTMVTIEYVPIYESVEDVLSDYWIDILKRMSLAMLKIGLGRIRTRFTQSNALWTQDGETLLQEGNEELKELRETLRVNSMYFVPRD